MGWEPFTLVDQSMEELLNWILLEQGCPLNALRKTRLDEPDHSVVTVFVTHMRGEIYDYVDIESFGNCRPLSLTFIVIGN